MMSKAMHRALWKYCRTTGPRTTSVMSKWMTQRHFSPQTCGFIQPKLRPNAKSKVSSCDSNQVLSCFEELRTTGTCDADCQAIIIYGTSAGHALKAHNWPLARRQVALSASDKWSKQHHVSLNSQFSFAQPTVLYCCFWKQHGHMLCLHFLCCVMRHIFTWAQIG